MVRPFMFQERTVSYWADKDVSAGQVWESRTGESQAHVEWHNSALVGFRTWDTEGIERVAVLDIDRFTRVFRQRRGGSL